MDISVNGVCDVTQLKHDDKVLYPCHEDGQWFLECGTVEGSNDYTDGVTLKGDGWHQYVSKFSILAVKRGEELIFIDSETGKQFEAEGVTAPQDSTIPIDWEKAMLISTKAG